jgi:hypothetical protein
MKPTHLQLKFGRAIVSSRYGVFVFAALLGLAGGVFAQVGPTADSSAKDPVAKDPGAKDAPAGARTEPGGLNEAESSLNRRYHQFERTLLQMAEYLRKTEPERADLLIRTIGKSKEDRVGLQMEQIIDLLKNDQLGDAIGRQEHLVANLKGLLELLQSEDRRHQLEEEKKWLESINQSIAQLSVRQKELRRATEQAGKLGPLAERQGKLGRDTKSLEEKIDKQDALRNASNPSDPSGKPSKSQNGRDSKEGDSKEGKQDGDEKNPDGSPKSKENGQNPQDKQNSAGKPGDRSQRGKSGDRNKQNGGKQSGGKQDGQKQDGQKQDSEKPDAGKQDAQKQDSEKQDGGKQDQQKQDQQKRNQQKQNQQKQGGKQGANKSKGGEKKPSQGSESEGQNDGSQQESPDSPSEQAENDPAQRQIPKKTPGREEIEQARRAMQKAEEELKRLDGNKSLEHQDEAIRKLREAKERLEKILRQLREEEQEIMLTSLEARFAKMLLMEIQIQVDTITLAKTAKNEWMARHFGKSRELSVRQDTIADDAGKALTLLKEEGSSVAFPQGVEQVRDDMLSIARSLGKNDVGAFTQSLEKEVIESLEELVSALQSEIENRKKPENQRRQGQRQRKSEGDENGKDLVEQLAELKMLRSLQLRVNRRTKEYGRMIHGEQATNDELTTQLQKLARRQSEIQEATYILASGRNR